MPPSLNGPLALMAPSEMEHHIQRATVALLVSTSCLMASRMGLLTWMPRHPLPSDRSGSSLLGVRPRWANAAQNPKLKIA